MLVIPNPDFYYDWSNYANGTLVSSVPNIVHLEGANATIQDGFVVPSGVGGWGFLGGITNTNVGYEGSFRINVPDSHTEFQILTGGGSTIILLYGYEDDLGLFEIFGVNTGGSGDTYQFPVTPGQVVKWFLAVKPNPDGTKDIDVYLDFGSGYELRLRAKNHSFSAQRIEWRAHDSDVHVDLGPLKVGPWTHDVTTPDIKVQRGVATIPPDATTVTLLAGTDYVAPSSKSRAFVRIVSNLYHSDGNSGTDFSQSSINTVSVYGDVEVGFTFERGRVDTRPVNVTWELIEYMGPAGGPNEFVVRYADRLFIDSVDNSTVVASGPIPGVISDEDVVVFITGQNCVGSVSQDEHDEAQYTTEWDAANQQVIARRGDVNRDSYVSVAVVEFTGSNWIVDRYEHMYTAVGTIETELISEVFAEEQTFIHPQLRQSSGTPASSGQQVWLSDDDELSFLLNEEATLANHVAVVWVIQNVQLNGVPMNVQRLSGTRVSDVGLDPDTWTHPITRVSDVATTSIWGETAYTVNGTDAFLVQMGFLLTDNDEVTLSRGRNRQPRYYRFEVVEWPTAVQAPSGDEVLGAASVTAEVSTSSSAVAGKIVSASGAASAEAAISTYANGVWPGSGSVTGESSTVVTGKVYRLSGISVVLEGAIPSAAAKLDRPGMSVVVGEALTAGSADTSFANEGAASVVVEAVSEASAIREVVALGSVEVTASVVATGKRSRLGAAIVTVDSAASATGSASADVLAAANVVAEATSPALSPKIERRAAASTTATVSASAVGGVYVLGAASVEVEAFANADVDLRLGRIGGFLSSYQWPDKATLNERTRFGRSSRIVK